MGIRMKSVVATTALAMVAPSQSALAQSASDAANALGAIIGALGEASVQSRLRKDVASMSAPLVFETANGPLDPADVSDPRNFDIAGVRLGMTPDQAKKAIAAAGYTIKNVGEQNSFDTEVRRMVSMGPNLTRINVPLYINASGKNQQELSVEFLALPEGPRVHRIEYQMNSMDMTQDAFRAQILRKYGDTASIDEGSSLKWCTANNSECHPLTEQANMEVDLERKFIRLEDEDEARQTALDERLQFEIDKRKPKVEEAQF